MVSIRVDGGAITPTGQRPLVANHLYGSDKHCHKAEIVIEALTDLHNPYVNNDRMVTASEAQNQLRYTS